VTEPGRVALLVVVAWLPTAVALLAARGALVSFLVAVLPGTAVALALRALVRQRASSILNRPRLPERYRIADDLTQPIAVVVEAAEAEAR
jgi:hypothetical protein